MPGVCKKEKFWVLIKLISMCLYGDSEQNRSMWERDVKKIKVGLKRNEKEFLSYSDRLHVIDRNWTSFEHEAVKCKNQANLNNLQI